MRRFAFFAHFDPRHEVKPYVVQHLRALRPHVERLVFLSTAALAPDETRKLDGLADALIARANLGFDFAMWRHALATEALDAVDELLLVNSSVLLVAPSLDDAFRRVAAVDADVVGLTENLGPTRHLQSWFLL